jgi:acetolactate synthase I/II/III large subunit
MDRIVCSERGIRYFFGSGGTDFGPIVDAYAKRLSTEALVPTPVTVPHEITAMAMAHGFTTVSGEPQVVMVHTIAGTANVTGGLINATRARGREVLLRGGHAANQAVTPCSRRQAFREVSKIMTRRHRCA